MSSKSKQRKMNEEDSDESYSSDSSGDDNDAYAGNEVISILQIIHLFICTCYEVKFKRKFSQVID